MRMLLHTKKQRKSIPAKKKARLLDTDAAAHKLQRESLSPDDKVQILYKNADAHKKQREALLLKKNYIFEE